MRFTQNLCARRGATVLELVVILTILVLLAGVLVPEVRDYLAESKAGRLATIYHTYGNGARNFWADTGSFAIEYGDATDADSHFLFYQPSTTPRVGWAGPYVPAPLTLADNPWERKIRLEKLSNTLGFDLDGDGADEIAQADNFFEIEGEGDYLADPIVQKLDVLIDGRTKADLNNPKTPYNTADDVPIGYPASGWDSKGRLKVQQNGNYFTIYIYVMDQG